MLKDNVYFNVLAETVRDWEEREAEREKLRAEAVARHGYSSSQVDEVRANKIADPYPLSNGTAQALGHWRDSAQDGREEIVVTDLVWDADVDDFLSAFEKAGVEAFVTVDRSTALMGDVHAFVKRGYAIDGICEIEKRTGLGKVRTIPGLRFVRRD